MYLRDEFDGHFAHLFFYEVWQFGIRIIGPFDIILNAKRMVSQKFRGSFLFLEAKSRKALLRMSWVVLYSSFVVFVIPFINLLHGLAFACEFCLTS